MGPISPTCLHAAFTLVDHKSAKMRNDLTVIFALLGYTCIKIAHKTMMKLTPAAEGNPFSISQT